MPTSAQTRGLTDGDRAQVGGLHQAMGDAIERGLVHDRGLDDMGKGRRAKKNQWDSDEQLDWSQTVDPSRPLVNEAQSTYCRMPLFKRC